MTLLKRGTFATALLLLQGCNVASVAKHMDAADGGLSGPNAAVGGVNYEVDGQPESRNLDEHINQCRKSGAQWTFSTASKPLLTVTESGQAAAVTLHTPDGDVPFTAAECGTVKLNVDAATGDGKVAVVCDHAGGHLHAGLRVAGCRG